MAVNRQNDDENREMPECIARPMLGMGVLGYRNKAQIPAVVDGLLMWFSRRTRMI